jgi:hypothetical protein
MNTSKAFLALGLLITATNSLAQYRCTENGKTIFTDKPCAITAEAIQTLPGQQPKKFIGDSANSAYASPTGAWRGQVQYQATLGTTVDSEAHAVIPITIEIDPQGKVTGFSPENNCKIKGIAAPGMMPNIVKLDVTLSDCRYAGFNRRMTGNLSVYQAEKHAQFSLAGYEMHKRPAGTYEIKGTLRR